jgi:Protein of unknown function (DUF1569)
MSPHLENCLTIVFDATKGGGAECAVRTDPKRWSVAEIVEHLTRAYSGTAKGFERCLEKGASLAGAATLAQRVRQFLVIDLGYFPQGREAPKHIIPTGALDLTAVLDAVRRDLARLDDAATRTREAIGTGKMLDHPILGPLSIDQWLKFHVVHSRHHAKQIRERRA